MDLDRPIFIVGHARGGSTALGSIINFHPDVGPKSPMVKRASSVLDLLQATRATGTHFELSDYLEQKDIWFSYFPGKDVFTHMGKELTVPALTLPPLAVSSLRTRLTGDLREKRYLSKAPTNSFRLGALRHLFPNARFVAVYRAGEEVIASWGRRSYGFGKKVAWGSFSSRRLSFARGITVFARKWLETITAVEQYRLEMNICAITYRELVTQPLATLQKVFAHLELSSQPYLSDVAFSDQQNSWRDVIPPPYRPLTRFLVRSGNRVLRRVEHENGIL